jgi:cytochrome c
MTIERTLLALAVSLALPASAIAAEDPAAKLAQSKGCLACHAPDKKIVGPAYKEVAKKYAGQPDAVNKLATKVIKGGSGVWGPVPMPPNAVSEAEAKQLVTWILKQK